LQSECGQPGSNAPNPTYHCVPTPEHRNEPKRSLPSVRDDSSARIALDSWFFLRVHHRGCGEPCSLVGAGLPALSSTAAGTRNTGFEPGFPIGKPILICGNLCNLWKKGRVIGCANPIRADSRDASFSLWARLSRHDRCKQTPDAASARTFQEDLELNMMGASHPRWVSWILRRLPENDRPGCVGYSFVFKERQQAHRCAM